MHTRYTKFLLGYELELLTLKKTPAPDIAKWADRIELHKTETAPTKDTLEDLRVMDLGREFIINEEDLLNIAQKLKNDHTNIPEKINAIFSLHCDPDGSGYYEYNQHIPKIVHLNFDQPYRYSKGTFTARRVNSYLPTLLR